MATPWKTPTMAGGPHINPMAAAPIQAMPNFNFGPQAAQLFSEISRPTLFEDKPEDWDRFDREWKKYEQLVGSTGYLMSDPMRLQILRSRVGPASQLILQELEDQNPHLPFAQYYQALARHYSRDASEQARKAWKRVRLLPNGEGIIDLYTFKKFCGEFKVYRNRVGDWTSTEEYTNLMENLPPFWITEVKKEENKRQRSRFWVKMTNAPDVTTAELKIALEDIGCHILEAKTTEGGFLIRARDETDQVTLENMSGHMLGDRAVKMSRAQIKMTGDEILAWMDERLRVQDEARECIAMYERPAPRPQYYVQEATRHLSFVPPPNPAMVLATSQVGVRTSGEPNPPDIKLIQAPPSSAMEVGSSKPNTAGDMEKSQKIIHKSEAVRPEPSTQHRSEGKGSPPAAAYIPPPQPPRQWTSNPPPYPPPPMGYPENQWVAQWYADPYAVPYQPWEPNRGKGKGKGKGGGGGQYTPGKGGQPDPGKGKGNQQWNGKGEGTGSQNTDRVSRPRSRSRDSNVVTNPDPNPGVWNNGYTGTSCWTCQRAGKDANHDYRKCQEGRQSAKSRSSAPQPKE